MERSAEHKRNSDLNAYQSKLRNTRYKYLWLLTQWRLKFEYLRLFMDSPKGIVIKQRYHWYFIRMIVVCSYLVVEEGWGEADLTRGKNVCLKTTCIFFNRLFVSNNHLTESSKSTLSLHGVCRNIICDRSVPTSGKKKITGFCCFVLNRIFYSKQEYGGKWYGEKYHPDKPAR